MKEFKLIVAGGRDFVNYEEGAIAITALGVELQGKGYDISVVSGMARGADAMGVQFARRNNFKLYEFPADWNRHGKSAGYKRNEQMAEFSDGLLAFWDGFSRGTGHMIDLAKARGLPVRIIYY